MRLRPRSRASRARTLGDGRARSLGHGAGDIGAGGVGVNNSRERPYSFRAQRQSAEINAVT